MEEDDFEYHANFPTPELTSDRSDGDKDSTENLAVVLLGWGGCSDKNLSKYSDIYNSRGYATLRYIYPAKYVFTLNPLDCIQPYAVKLVETIQDLSLDEQPIIFHLFSNAGSAMYYAISEHLKSTANTSIQVRGCIFDSGPASVNFSGRMKVLASLTPGGTVRKYASAFVTTIWLYMSDFFRRLTCLWTSKKYTNWNYTYNQLALEDSRWPQLFLFSKADTLCNYRDIEAFVEKRRRKGVDVTTILWDDSPHVGHLLLHRETYINQIFHFVKKCLSKKL